MAYSTTPSCMHMALLQLQALISIGLLLASMSSGSAEEAPSGYGIELIHVDANGGFTREELIHRGVDRTHLRAEMLSATHGDDTKNSPASSSSGTDSVAAVHRRHHEYLMKLEIGTQRESFLVVPDTGSDLVWTTKPCDRIPSFTIVNCSDPDNNRVTCDICFLGLCMFDRKFGNGMKSATGFIGNQTLTLSTAHNVSIGCAYDNDKHLMPKSAEGIVGLNRGNMSLVRQLNLTNFSYCLGDQQSSRLWLGDGYDLDKLKEKYDVGSELTTPLVQVEGIEDTSVWANMYYVQLEGISIGGNVKYQQLPESSFKRKSKNDKYKGVMLVDSGHSRTKLEKDVFEALEKLLTEELLTKEKYQKTERTCFRPPTDAAASSKQPEMVLHFAHRAKMRLPWANYMDKVVDESGTKFCLAILENQGEAFQGSILGTFQQLNTYMLYNLTKGHEELSFVRVVDCHKP